MKQSYKLSVTTLTNKCCCADRCGFSISNAFIICEKIELEMLLKIWKKKQNNPSFSHFYAQRVHRQRQASQLKWLDRLIKGLPQQQIPDFIYWFIPKKSGMMGISLFWRFNEVLSNSHSNPEMPLSWVYLMKMRRCPGNHFKHIFWNEGDMIGIFENLRTLSRA